METNKHAKNGTNAFLWGFILGAIFASLLVTKKGRRILKEITGLGLEMVEDFIEEKKHTQKVKPPVTILDEEDEIQAAEDIKSEIVEEDVIDEKIDEAEPDEPVKEVTATKSSSSKKRLFRGIKKK
ncbi:MAG TPA: hypothetical protein VG965_06335 [Patescibacteria group bacterium]|nr:hypothetical protein [Patescibacteria group bacterium]